MTGTYSNSSTEIMTVTAADVSGFDSSSAAVSQPLTVTIGGKTDTFNVDIVPTLTGIAITTPPSKLVYDIGETIDLTGIIITGTYTDGTTKAEPSGSAVISGFNSNYAVLGQVVTINLNGKTAEFQVDIVPTLFSIAITVPADKLVFNTDDPLDITGMVITGTYTDGNTKIETVTAANVSGFDSSVPFTGQQITVTISGKTTVYEVDIVQPVLVSIAVTTPPNKLIYTTGDVLDLTGLVVTGTYDDESTKLQIITMDNISGFDSSVPASNQAVTVTCEGNTTTFMVQIMAPAPVVDFCTPDTGSTAGGTAVTISGLNFQAGCLVYFGGTAASAASFVDSMTIDAVSPYHSSGEAVDVLVRNPDGRQGILSAGFVYAGNSPTNTPTSTATRTVTATSTETVTTTISETATATVTNTSSPTKSATATITKTGTITPTVTESPTSTESTTVTESPTQSVTGTITVTNTTTSTPTGTSTESPTLTITGTATQSSTVTSTSTITVTASATPVITATNTHIPTAETTGAQSGSSYVKPQPAKDFMTIVYALDEPAVIKVNIFNAAGIPVADSENNGTASVTNEIIFDIKKFAPGVYYYLLNAKSASGKEIKFKPGKFIVVK